MALAVKPQEALELWRRALVTTVRGGGADLSARQLAVVLTVYLTPPPHTVRGLASLLKIHMRLVLMELDGTLAGRLRGHLLHDHESSR